MDHPGPPLGQMVQQQGVLTPGERLIKPQAAQKVPPDELSSNAGQPAVGVATFLRRDHYRLRLRELLRLEEQLRQLPALGPQQVAEPQLRPAGLQLPEQRLQELGVDGVVAVQKKYVLPGGLLQPPVPGCRDAPVLLVNDSHPAIPGA